MTFGRKEVYRLPVPGPEDAVADRERLLAACHAEGLTLEALRELPGALHRGGYRVTATLSPTDSGWRIVRVEPGDTTGRLFGLALDLGSTTLNLELLDLHTGAVLARADGTNSQRAVSTNILDRILYAKDRPDHLEALQTAVVGDINGLIADCCGAAAVDPAEIAVLAVGGNTTMIHLLLGCDPWQIFQTPYTPVFFDPGIFPAGDIGLTLRCSLFCMPAVANYLGGDITGGLLTTDLDTRQDLALFLDIGTNGEIAFGNRDFLLVGAGAAGPALEGALSKSGMRAKSGAVCSVVIDGENELHVHTVDDAPPVGICGSGILDLIAQGFLAGWIGGDGSLNAAASPRIRTVLDETSQRPTLAIIYADGPTEPLYFTENDIREFIRCKAAAYTMVATLLDACGASPADLGTVYLSGGFGEHLNLESAITVGMYPDIPREKFKILGNTSLAGVKMLLMNRDCLTRVRQFAARAQYVQFGQMEHFLSNMVAAEFLPNTDRSAFPSVKCRT